MTEADTNQDVLKTLDNMSKGLVELSNTVKILGTRVSGISGCIDRLQSEDQRRCFPIVHPGNT